MEEGVHMRRVVVGGNTAKEPVNVDSNREVYLGCKYKNIRSRWVRVSRRQRALYIYIIETTRAFV